MSLIDVFGGAQKPTAKSAYDYLKEKNLIFPGSIIGGDAIQEAIGWGYDAGSWEFLGPYLLLKNKIESEGYFISQKKLTPPGFRILDTEEMADYAKRKLTKNLVSNFKISLIMATHDCSKLDDDRKKEYKQIQSQAAQSALMQQKMLFGDQFF